MEIKQRTHYAWIDVLRIVAIGLMVLSHACDGYVSQFDTNRVAFLSGSLTGSFARACVPLFVMITGALMFPTNMSMTVFYKKRIGRILKPLVFWSLITPILFYLYFNFIYPQTVNPSIDLANHNIGATLNKMALFFINFNYDTTPLWYLYMLIGLYLISPILGAWLKQATKREFEIFLTIWSITLFLPYVEMVAPFLGYKGNYGSMAIMGESFWNKYGVFYNFSGFVGYLLLGHYLVKYPLSWSVKKSMLIAIPTFLIGFAITGLGFLSIQNSFPGNYEYLEIVWYFTGINVAMMTVSIFVIVQKMNISYSKGLANFAKLMFGVYLIHYIVVQTVYDLFINTPLHPLMQIISIAIISFFISCLIALPMNKWRVTRQFVS